MDAGYGDVNNGLDSSKLTCAGAITAAQSVDLLMQRGLITITREEYETLKSKAAKFDEIEESNMAL